MPTNTTRLSLPQMTGPDLLSSISNTDQAAKAILDTAAVWHKDVFVNRPAANSVVDGYVFEATDTGVIYIGDGTNWHEYESAFSSYKVFTVVNSTALGSVSSGTVELINPVTALTPISAGSAATGFYIDPADFTAGSRSTKFRLRLALAVNSTAPTSTFTLGLYPQSAIGGASHTVTLGTVVSGSTAAIAAPSASAVAKTDGSDFTISSAGMYFLGLLVTTTMAVSSLVSATATLEVRQV